uniref:RING-type domain-containing protein n=1 Tax=Oryza meridionalis TaxID=40149 RepID=A0A0E0CID2_9ORYZ
MKCNACWRELEGQAVSTTCGTEDAKKILSNDAACPICDQVLSKSHMRPVDTNPNDDWTNSAYRSVMFYIGQKELEMQYKMNRIVGQCRQKCELMQAKFTEKLEEVHTAYQKMAKKCQLMEQEIENLSRDKQELQEKFAEKSRQKRKLDEMYDQLRSEYESAKRSAIQPANNYFPRAQPDLFSGMPNIMDSSDPLRQVPTRVDDLLVVSIGSGSSSSADPSATPSSRGLLLGRSARPTRSSRPRRRWTWRLRQVLWVVPSSQRLAREGEAGHTKRKLDEMYDQLRSEYESAKRSAIQPANNYFPRAQPDLFSGMPNIMDSSDPLRQGRRDEGWAPPPRQRRSTSGPFELSAGSPAHNAVPPVDIRPRQPARPVFGTTMNNTSAALRNMIISPVKRPQLSRNRPHMFTYLKCT